MKFSKLFLYTSKEFPKDADVISEKMLRKGGYIVKSHAGAYYYTPMMKRVLTKIKNIISEEMEKAGAQEVLLPILMKKELWEESGRWDDYISENIMYHLKNRKNMEMCLGPTHEEAVTDLVRKSISSYKQLPIILYQQNTKFRDEIRPRFGLIRGSEFIMKDAYSFDYTREGLNKSYQIMRKAYQKIFEKLGFDYQIVQADSGTIGGDGSEEFMAIADSGEDEIIYCKECNYAANVEKADSILEKVEFKEKDKELSELHTPAIKSVDQLVEFTGIAQNQMIKTIIYRMEFGDDDKLNHKFAAVMIRGDLEINEFKVKNYFDCLNIELASEEDVRRLTRAEVGFAGPFNMDKEVALMGDNSIKDVEYFLCGLNKTDYHNINVCFERDLELPELGDFKLAKENDFCPVCRESRLKKKRGIELGHIFKLGTKYSEKMGATVLDKNGKKVPLIMGCYGIGTSRIAAAMIEQRYDENGMLWPDSIAPYHFNILQMGRDEDVKMAAEQIYEDLQEQGYETLLDDRNVSPGFKFKDADLIGIPYSIIVGKKVKEGKVEFKIRKDNQKVEIERSELNCYIKKLFIGKK